MGLQVLNAQANLRPSRNTWDWLADGIYFWEQNPLRALQYAQESAIGKQFNRKPIQVPFVRYIHRSNELSGAVPFDTVRSAFQEGEDAYPGATFSSRLHIQVCVRNLNCIKGFFLPRPVQEFNPNL